MRRCGGEAADYIRERTFLPPRQPGEAQRERGIIRPAGVRHSGPGGIHVLCPEVRWCGHSGRHSTGRFERGAAYQIAPQGLRRGIEDHLGTCLGHMPVAARDFPFQLPGRPAGIPGKDAQAGSGPLASQEFAQQLGIEAHEYAGHEFDAVLGVRLGAKDENQHPRRNRSAGIEPVLDRVQTDDVFEEVMERNFGRTVEDEADGFFPAVSGDQHDAALEVGVGDPVGSDEQYAVRANLRIGMGLAADTAKCD